MIFIWCVAQVMVRIKTKVNFRIYSHITEHDSLIRRRKRKMYAKKEPTRKSASVTKSNVLCFFNNTQCFFSLVFSVIVRGVSSVRYMYILYIWLCT